MWGYRFVLLLKNRQLWHETNFVSDKYYISQNTSNSVSFTLKAKTQTTIQVCEAANNVNLNQLICKEFWVHISNDATESHSSSHKTLDSESIQSHLKIFTSNHELSHHFVVSGSSHRKRQVPSSHAFTRLKFMSSQTKLDISRIFFFSCNWLISIYERK